MSRREVTAAAAIVFDSDKSDDGGDYKILALAYCECLYFVLERGSFYHKGMAEDYFKVCEKNAAGFFDKWAMDNCKRVPSKNLEVGIFLAKSNKGVYTMVAESHYDYSFYKEEVIESLKERYDYEALCAIASANAGDVIPSRVAGVIPAHVCDCLQDSITEEAAARIFASFEYDEEEDNILLDAVSDYLSPDFGFFHVSAYYRNMTLGEFVAARIKDALDVQIRVIVRKVFGYDASELA